MRITIVTVGSLGDVRPYVALGAGLQCAGHRVRLATHAEHALLARAYGLEFFTIAGSSADVLASDEGRRWQHSGQNPIRFLTGLIRVIEPFMRRVIGQTLSACQDAEIVVTSLLAFYAAYHVAEKLRVRLCPAFYLPLSPTSAFPTVMWPARSLGGTLNWWTHRFTGQLMWEPLRPALNRLRGEVLDLPPLPPWRVARDFFAERWPILYGYSPNLVPRAREWGPGVHVTGYWFLEPRAAWAPPAPLAAFLDDGPPPVYVGFGSMHVHDSHAMTALVVEALAKANRRGVLLTGAGGLGERVSESVIGVASLPHDWLFPRMAAVVHHAGVGTTATAVRAGVPSVVVPFFADQPFWASRVSALGLSPPPIPRRALSADRLAAAIRLATSNTGMARRATAMGARVKAEDGVARAVETFQQAT
jgi:UDP:flavonoid glycosyltransferase YjiC (YdhE family)